jgi:nucleoside transporter
MTLEYATPAAEDSQTRLKVQLCVFMFLQYYIWGSWYVSMGSYIGGVLKFNDEQGGLAYGAFALGAMIAPFFVGLIADRYFASEKILGVLGVLGGIILFLVARAQTFSTFYPLLILYCASYTPTLALGNSLSLHQLKDAKRAFPRVKSLSAVGWIAGGLTVSAIGGETNNHQFYLAAALSVIFGLFSFTLPHTPPKKVGGNVSIGEILGLDALALLRRGSFAIFIACMFMICIPLYFYFAHLHVYLGQLQWTNIAAKMTLAQISDVIFLIALPVMLRSFGFKWTIFIGILAWVTRFFLLSQSIVMPVGSQAAFIFGAIVLHGVCYDFLFIAGQLYVDSESNERIRGAAQGFIAFILWGVGGFVGTLLAGIVKGHYKLAEPTGTILHDWRGIWMTPALLAVVVLAIFLIFFRESKAAIAEAELPKKGTTLDESPL